MKILHITPHLGVGVGKAHAAMSGILARQVDQSYLLLEEPRDRRYADVVAGNGGRVRTARDLDDVARSAAEADIVQFEFWNHPRLFECLARALFRAMRSVLWSHVSGVSRPVIPVGLIEEAGRFVFTTPASLALPFVAGLPADTRRRVSIINSGFGFPVGHGRKRTAGGPLRIAYLGTVDFEKMHPGFFAVIDRLTGYDIRVAVWGEPSPEVVERAQSMAHPERIRFGGQTGDPAAALADADIFFYPLHPDHYGTAENALVEAMSLGLAPVVLNNPAEMAIVRHDDTGYIARSLDECVMFLDKLLSSPGLRDRMAERAVADVADSRSPARSAEQFVALWQGLMNDPPRRADFRRAIGDCPAEWFLATQGVSRDEWDATERTGSQRLAKGTLAHFESAFPGDASLAPLRRGSALSRPGVASGASGVPLEVPPRSWHRIDAGLGTHG